MKIYSWLSVLVIVLLSACGTFEVSIEQPTPTVSPGAVTSDHIQGLEQSTIGDVQEGDLFVEEASTGWGKIVIVPGDGNWIAMIDDGQGILLIYHPESQPALGAVYGNGQGTEDIYHSGETDSNSVVPGLSRIQWTPDAHIHEQALQSPVERIVSVQPLDDMPAVLVNKTASVLFMNSSNSLPVLIDFSDSLNTFSTVND